MCACVFIGLNNLCWIGSYPQAILISTGRNRSALLCCGIIIVSYSYHKSKESSVIFMSSSQFYLHGAGLRTFKFNCFKF